MKFGALLRSTSCDLPEVECLFTTYKHLKKELKKLPEKDEALQSATGTQDQQLSLSSDETCFVAALDRKLADLNNMFMEREEEAVIRLGCLQQEAPEGMDPEKRREVHKRLVDFHGEVLLLVHWSVLAYTATVKILKKHHKRTGLLLRAPQLEDLLSQPFCSTELMTQLALKAEQSIHEIGGSLACSSATSGASEGQSAHAGQKHRLSAPPVSAEVRSELQTDTRPQHLQQQLYIQQHHPHHQHQHQQQQLHHRQRQQQHQAGLHPAVKQVGLSTSHHVHSAPHPPTPQPQGSPSTHARSTPSPPPLVASGGGLILKVGSDLAAASAAEQARRKMQGAAQGKDDAHLSPVKKRQGTSTCNRRPHERSGSSLDLGVGGGPHASRLHKFGTSCCDLVAGGVKGPVGGSAQIRAQLESAGSGSSSSSSGDDGVPGLPQEHGSSDMHGLMCLLGGYLKGDAEIRNTPVAAVLAQIRAEMSSETLMRAQQQKLLQNGEKPQITPQQTLAHTLAQPLQQQPHQALQQQQQQQQQQPSHAQPSQQGLQPSVHSMQGHTPVLPTTLSPLPRAQPSQQAASSPLAHALRFITQHVNTQPATAQPVVLQPASTSSMLEHAHSTSLPPLGQVLPHQPRPSHPLHLPQHALQHPGVGQAPQQHHGHCQQKQQGGQMRPPQRYPQLQHPPQMFAQQQQQCPQHQQQQQHQKQEQEQQQQPENSSDDPQHGSSDEQRGEAGSDAQQQPLTRPSFMMPPPGLDILRRTQVALNTWSQLRATASTPSTMLDLRSNTYQNRNQDCWGPTVMGGVDAGGGNSSIGLVGGGGSKAGAGTVHMGGVQYWGQPWAEGAEQEEGGSSRKMPGEGDNGSSGKGERSSSGVRQPCAQKEGERDVSSGNGERNSNGVRQPCTQKEGERDGSGGKGERSSSGVAGPSGEAVPSGKEEEKGGMKRGFEGDGQQELSPGQQQPQGSGSGNKKLQRGIHQSEGPTATVHMRGVAAEI